MSKDEKQALIEKVRKEFPQSTVAALGDFCSAREFIPTGSLVLDCAVGCQGFPLGRVIELVGPEGSGKTSIANSVIANAQLRGYDALFIDLEYTYNKEFAIEMFGVNPDKLHIVQTLNAEDAMGIMEAFIEARVVNIIVVDSIPTLLGEEEVEKSFNDPEKIGSHARLVSRMMKRIVPLCGSNDVMFIAINQLRDTIGYAPIPTGGRGLKCWKAMSIQMKAGDKIDDKGVVIGREMDFTVIKNKYGTPFGQGSFSIYWAGEHIGIGNIADIVTLATKGKIIVSKGGWLEFEGMTMRKRDMVSYFMADPDAFDDLLGKVGMK
jgi:recombination protein RecA